MIQTTQKSRSGRAVLAAGALVASLLVTAAVPASAATDRADHAIRLSACVGDAAVDQQFADVSAGHVFREAINCIAYYGITQGTGDGSTYSPEQDVTRAQMAVFVVRAAEAAGVDLGDVTDAGFSDIGNIWQEAQDAINQLASKGMISSAGGVYRPDDAITRAEMATFLVGLLVEASPSVTKDSTGAILLGEPGSRSVADDWFADARSSVAPANDAEISAIYELGVTKGATPADEQDDTEPPLDLNYEPDGTVDRGQMAAFITRALAHTTVRPAGVSAQYDGTDVIVSVRNAQFQPVSRAAVDVFWTTSDQMDQALADNGTCHLTGVTQADRSSLPCEIDSTDPITERDGDARVAVAGLQRVPKGGATVWAWTGQDGDTLTAGSEPYSFEVAEGADLGFATTTLVTRSLNAPKARFGSTVLLTLQLRDLFGNVSTGVNGVDPAQWILSVQKPDEDPEVQTLVSDGTGGRAFSISLDDPNPGTNDADLEVTYTLTPADNAPIIVDAGGLPAGAGMVTFSDDAPSLGQDATVIIKAPDYLLVSGLTTTISVFVTVLDQYGSPFPGAMVNLNGGSPATVDSRGSHGFTHQYSGSDGQSQDLTVGYGVTSAGPGSATATVHWVVDGGPSSDGNDLSVLTGDVRRREIVVADNDANSTPLLVAYDDNDRFNLRGEPTSIAVFEAVLAEALRRESPGLNLAWSNYRAGSDRRVTEYSLN